MTRFLRWLTRRDVLLLISAIVLALGAAAAYYLTNAVVLTVAVAPRDGTEPALIRAYAEALAAQHADVRFKILSFDDVKESAQALESGRADLAVVRPDVMLPANGLTLLILRDQAMVIASPGRGKLRSFIALAGKRLGIGAHKDIDLALIRDILGYYDLVLSTAPAGTAIASNEVRLVNVDDDQAVAAIREGRIDAFVSIIAPSAPKALALINGIKAVSPGGKVAFVEVDDDAAVIERFPQLQSVTVPGGLFGGRPKLPADDVATVGTAYRLMARASLSRAVAADITQALFELRPRAAAATESADYIKAPAYETTAIATSAPIPIHPGALDYYERDRHGFIERYADTLYLLAALAGGIGSAVAWLRERLMRLRRERVDELIERLLALATSKEPGTAQGQVDVLVDEAIRTLRDRELAPGVTAALTLAIERASANPARSMR